MARKHGGKHTGNIHRGSEGGHTGKTRRYAGSDTGEHTGPITHGHMTSYIDGHGGKDGHAHESHHHHNKGVTPQGLSTTGHYDGGHEGNEHGGEGMSGNCCYEDG